MILVAKQHAAGAWEVVPHEHGQSAPPLICRPGPWRQRIDEWMERAGAGAIEVVVLLRAEAEPVAYPVTESLLPCPVVSLPRGSALAAFAPDELSRFAVVEAAESEVCGVVTRAGAGHFYYAESKGPQSGAAARSFGFETAVVGGDIIAGAARLAIAALREDGVYVCDPGAGQVLRLATRRATAYSILHPIGGVFNPAVDCLAELVSRRPVLFAVDEHVMQLYGHAIRGYAATRLGTPAFATVSPVESSKSWGQVLRVCEQASQAGLPRHGVIVGVGGGVTLDLAGMAAALYHRGVGYIRVPTTLLGMADVAVGIKHAVNFNGRKSLLGAFYPPLAAINDFSFLETLPEREIANGLSEIIKLGLVRDRALFEWVEQDAAELVASRCRRPPGAARRIALRAEYVMMADLQPNLYEADVRRLPDFGHTFSPAIEEATDFAVSHGEAVALDMLLATIVAVDRAICSSDVLRRLSELCRALSLLVLPDACTPELLACALQAVRLRRNGHVHMVVPRRLGEGCFIEDVSAAEVRRALLTAAGICAATEGGCRAGAGL
jgi:3-dehydroquinate synthase